MVFDAELFCVLFLSIVSGVSLVFLIKILWDKLTDSDY